MPRIKYVNKRFNSATKVGISLANSIIAEYQQQGFDLTLRQLYYQFVARDAFSDDRKWTWTGRRWIRDENGTKNAEPNYKWLGSIVNDARLAGLIDWKTIQDRTRNLRARPHWKSPHEIVEACADQYSIDRWLDQPYRPEVWIEKDALVGVIEDVCTKLDVPYFSCRGYTSQSEMWRAAQRLRGYIRGDQTPVIFHFGDHDPSGKDMSRDIQDRLELFLRVDLDIEPGESIFEFHRLALTMDQIDEFQPPPNPAKITDSRARAYIAEFGNESWELDALEPKVIVGLIEAAIGGVIKRNTYNAAVEVEKKGCAALALVADNWNDVMETLENQA
jgi:hypothetical protein